MRSGAGRNLCQRIPQPGASTRKYHGVHHYYNRARLPLAVGYKPPEVFEQVFIPVTGATMSLFRHEEIFRSDMGSKIEGELAETSSPTIGLDESPVGYSSAGWSPPDLPPLCQLRTIVAEKELTEQTKPLDGTCANCILFQWRDSPQVHPTTVCPKCAHGAATRRDSAQPTAF